MKLKLIFFSLIFINMISNSAELEQKKSQIIFKFKDNKSLTDGMENLKKIFGTDHSQQLKTMVQFELEKPLSDNEIQQLLIQNNIECEIYRPVPFKLCNEDKE